MPLAWLPLVLRDPTTRAKEELLESPQRKLILDLVTDRPGLPVGEIMARSGLGSGTVYHHLMTLVRAGLISTRIVGRRRLVFASARTPPPTADSRYALLFGAKARRVAEVVVARPGLTITDVISELGGNPRAIYYHVKRLRDANLIVASSGEGHFKLSPTPLLVEILAKFRLEPTVPSVAPNP